MSDIDPIGRAKADRAEVLRQITQLDAEIARVNQLRLAQIQQRDRLAAFIDLYAKYTAPIVPPPAAAEQSALPAAPGSGEVPEGDDAVGGNHSKAAAVPKAKQKRRSAILRKPKSAPPMPDMIKTALLDAQVHGRMGLSPREMQEFISRRWWPSVKAGQVSPIAWRMFSRGDLRKEGAVYALPAESDGVSTTPDMLGSDESEERGDGPMLAKLVGEP